MSRTATALVERVKSLMQDGHTLQTLTNPLLPPPRRAGRGGEPHGDRAGGPREAADAGWTYLTNPYEPLTAPSSQGWRGR